jgi:CO/xanthine dehydrogenase Mo-binding subunit
LPPPAITARGIHTSRRCDDRGHVHRGDDGYGPFGAKTVGESGIILGPAAVATAISDAIGRRMKDLPITRDKILGALA